MQFHIVIILVIIHYNCYKSLNDVNNKLILTNKKIDLFHFQVKENKRYFNNG